MKMKPMTIREAFQLGASIVVRYLKVKSKEESIHASAASSVMLNKPTHHPS
jgi:hypothetical protein